VYRLKNRKSGQGPTKDCRAECDLTGTPNVTTQIKEAFRKYEQKAVTWSNNYESNGCNWTRVQNFYSYEDANVNCGRKGTAIPETGCGNP
jgi:hypothetical protein